MEKQNLKVLCLDDLKVGECGVVLDVKSPNVFVRRRLYEMGITKGVLIKIKKIAPLGDPVGIELRGYELALRKEELKNVEVKKQ